MTCRKLRIPVVRVGVFVLMGSLGTANAQTIVVTAKSAAERCDGLEHVIKAVAPADDPMATTALNTLGQVKSGAMLKGSQTPTLQVARHPHSK
jgi:hypothetical protein